MQKIADFLNAGVKVSLLIDVTIAWNLTVKHYR